MTTTPSAAATFHQGELLVQAQAGLASTARRVGQMLQPSIPPVAEAFLLDQPWVVIGGTDGAGQVWASALFGAPGFLQALDARTLQIGARPGVGDPVSEAVEVGRRLGVLAIDLGTRRRMRVNGTVVAVEANRFEIATAEVYSNCPKYIQQRVFDGAEAGRDDVPESRVTTSLSEGQRAWIGTADTFFIATAHPERGADVSHRGGQPGFVRALDERTLVFPDYAGNAMFQTLGNIAVQPAAGLLFVDFAGGSTLQVTGRAEILWGEAAQHVVPDAERAVRLEIVGVREVIGLAIPAARLIEYSPFNPPIGRSPT
jgi:predicted pyridoxine 5'-phosphate oxidase superfamily flavin-nucleotide-binding protein